MTQNHDICHFRESWFRYKQLACFPMSCLFFWHWPSPWPGLPESVFLASLLGARQEAKPASWPSSLTFSGGQESNLYNSQKLKLNRKQSVAVIPIRALVTLVPLVTPHGHLAASSSPMSPGSVSPVSSLLSSHPESSLCAALTAWCNVTLLLSCHIIRLWVRSAGHKKHLTIEHLKFLILFGYLSV